VQYVPEVVDELLNVLDINTILTAWVQPAQLPQLILPRALLQRVDPVQWGTLDENIIRELNIQTIRHLLQIPEFRGRIADAFYNGATVQGGVMGGAGGEVIRAANPFLLTDEQLELLTQEELTPLFERFRGDDRQYRVPMTLLNNLPLTVLRNLDLNLLPIQFFWDGREIELDRLAIYIARFGNRFDDTFITNLIVPLGPDHVADLLNLVLVETRGTRNVTNLVEFVKFANMF
jgi:hypothetical protein